MENLSYVKYQPEWGVRNIPDIPECSISELCVSEPAKKYPEKTAIISFDRKFSYGEFDELSNRVANALIERGIQKGERVATFLPNIFQHFIAFYGITKAGAISVPCNVMYKGEELLYQLNDSGCKAIIAMDVLYPTIASIKGRCALEHIFLTNVRDYASPGAKVPSLYDKARAEAPPGTLDFIKVIEGASPEIPKVDIDPMEDLAMILYTSGTTGVPKGAMLTHYNYCSAGTLLPNAYGMNEKDVHILIFPMFHVAGYCFHMQALSFGATVIPIAMFDPKEMLEIIEKYKATVIFAPPTAFIGMMNHPDIKKHDLSSLRIAAGCGAPVPPEIQKNWEGIVGTPLGNGLGCTETSGTAPGIVVLPGKPGPRESLGSTICEAKIVDKEGKIVPRGTIGEVAHRGPGIAKGYWNKPEETKAQFTEDGWWLSGDAAYMDEDGNIFFQYRIKDLVISSGYNVSPVDVENVIYKHEAVKEVCAYGIPDSYRGESIKVLITLKDEYKGKVTEQEIINWCKGEMAAFKVPKVIEFGEIPKTASGKALRYMLRDRDKEKYSKA